MKVTAPNLIRAAGLSAVVTGIIFTAILPIQPPDGLVNVNTNAFILIESGLAAAVTLPLAFGLARLCLEGVLRLVAAGRPR